MNMRNFTSLNRNENVKYIIALILFSLILVIPLMQLIKLIALSVPIEKVWLLFIKYAVEILLAVVGIVFSIAKLRKSRN